MSLSDALRAAALDRARQNGQNVDGIVLEPSGVIDLREMARAAGREEERRVKLPMLAGRMSEERVEEGSLSDTSLWRRLRPVTPQPATPGEVDIDLTTPESLAPSEPAETTELEADIVEESPDMAIESSAMEPLVIDLTDRSEPPSVYERNDAPTEATLADEVGRPVAVCDHCGSFGQRDLFDRVSGTEYFSCDDCGHMWQQRNAD